MIGFAYGEGYVIGVCIEFGWVLCGVGYRGNVFVFLDIG